MLSGCFKTLLATSVSLVLLSTSVMADMLIDNFDAAVNDRFADSASFIGDGFDRGAIRYKNVNVISVEIIQNLRHPALWVFLRRKS